jgi:ribosomal protein S18 acetylase RimI-like enzyme
MPCRQGQQQDSAALARLSVDAWQAAYRGIMPSEFLGALSVVDAQASWERAFSEGHPSVVVFELNQQVVGVCLFGASRDQDAAPGTAEIIALNVHPDYWRRGLGSQLTAFALDLLRVQGFRCATLWVLQDNSRARQFYEDYGFRPDHATRSTSALIGSPLCEVRYRITLGPAA